MLKPDFNIILKVKVSPGAKERKMIKLDEDYFKVYLKSAPEKNKANKELIEFLASRFRVRKDQITIIRGEKTKIKFISIKRND